MVIMIIIRFCNPVRYVTLNPYQKQVFIEGIMGVYRNRIVVKAGTSTLMNELGKSDLHNMERLCRVLADIRNRGYELILVSSGAIAFGCGKLGLRKKPDSIREKQAAAAVGQCSMLNLYDRFFGDYDVTVAQILLSGDDLGLAAKRENLLNTFDTLLGLGVVPIVNENDSVNFSEIESEDHLFGDNDLLSAEVAVLCRAGRLILLSDTGGLYDRDPRLYPDAKLRSVVERIDEDVFASLGTRGSRRGADGMKTKLRAAARATAAGTETCIVGGKDPEALYRVIRGEPVGTRFIAE